MKVKKQKNICIFLKFNCFIVMSVQNSKEKMKITDFLKLFFWRWAHVLSHQFFQRLARGLRPNNGVVQRGNTTGTTIGKHNGGNKTGNNREKWKVKKNRFFILFSCFKIMSVHKPKEKKQKSQIFEYFLEMGTSPKSSIFHSIYIHTLFSRY